MGNENSTTTEESPKITSSRPSSSYPASTAKTQTRLKSKVLEKSAPSHNYQQHSYSHQSRQPKGFVPVLKSSSYASNERSTVGKPLSSAVIQQQISSSSHHSSNDISSPPTVTASGFEKAPMIQLNYVVKSSDNESINTYGPGNITVMRRTSSKFGPYANKWYENDNNKNAKPLAVEYF